MVQSTNPPIRQSIIHQSPHPLIHQTACRSAGKPDALHTLRAEAHQLANNTTINEA